MSPHTRAAPSVMGFLNFVKSFGSSGARSGVLSDASREQVSARTLGDEFPADAKFFGLENFIG